MPTPTTLSDLAALLGAAPAGRGGDVVLTGVAALADATGADVSFVTSEHYARAYPATKAGAVIAPRALRLPGKGPPVLAVDDVELAVARVLARFAPPVPRPAPGVDPTARVAPDARLGDAVAVGATATVGARCSIGARSVIHPGAHLGDDVVVGEDCELHPNVVVRERVTIGSRVIIHAGSVLGTDGFGYRWDGRQHVKVPQIGTVVIEDDVEIGSCVCIDRAKFSATRVGRGTKIDNLVQIGHNVVIGPHCIIVGQAGVAGSATLGTGVVLGGQTAVRDHVTLGDGAMAAACAAIADDVKPGTVVSGMPALPHRQSLREQAALRHLPELRQQVKKLQEEIELLKSQRP